MHMKYFGDSFDIVKMSLIGWLQCYGEWSVHPMFTETPADGDVRAFEEFLGARIISTEVLTSATDRENYLSCTTACGNLFLDPDTGIKLKPTTGKRAPEYLFAAELVRIAHSRPKALTLVFGKSLPRGQEKAALADKMKALPDRGIFGFGYISHACFLVVGCDRGLVESAYNQVISASRLPATRFHLMVER